MKKILTFTLIICFLMMCGCTRQEENIPGGFIAYYNADGSVDAIYKSAYGKIDGTLMPGHEGEYCFGGHYKGTIKNGKFVYEVENCVWEEGTTTYQCTLCHSFPLN